jgi:hypothetical protein
MMPEKSPNMSSDVADGMAAAAPGSRDLGAESRTGGRAGEASDVAMTRLHCGHGLEDAAAIAGKQRRNQQ